ncbi:MAG: hypothetical protein FWE28_04565 [Oscillospiraceae bacterium]|nr:hypothetical protein [Oscillospiraceae bacterium]
MKRLIIVLLLGILILTACSSEEDQAVYAPQPQALIAEQTAEDFPSFQTNSIFTELHTIGSVAPFGNGFFAYASTREDPEAMRLLFCNVEDGSIEAVPYAFSGDDIRQITVTPDGLILAVENIRTLSDEGTALDSFVVHNLSGNSPAILIEGPPDTAANRVVAAKDGYIYLHAFGWQEEFIFTYNLAGELLHTEIFEEAMIWDIAFSDKESEVFFAKMEGESTNIYVLADDTREGLLEMGNQIPSLHSGSAYGVYILLDGSVFGFDPQSGALVPVIHLSRLGIVGHVVSVFSHEDDYIIVFEDRQSGEFSIFALTPTEGFTGENITLRLATMAVVGDHYIDAAVAHFNRLNPQYFIEVINYYRLYGEEALTRFNMDMITGNAPDILLLASPVAEMTYPIQAYISGGILADLAPFKARDLDTGQLFSTALDALHRGEASCFVAPSFSLQVLLGTEEAIAQLEGKSLLEFLEFLRADSLSGRPLFATDLEPRAFVEHMVTVNLDYFVDYRSGTANFDSEEFIALLQVAGSLESTAGVPADIRIAQGQQGFAFMPIRTLVCLEVAANILAGNFQITGFPSTQNGLHGVSMVPEYLFAVSAASPHTEAAWTFLR